MLGIFDSGLGGLTVVSEIKKRYPDVDLIYFGDAARVPWGNKSQALVQHYADEICQFLISQGADKIIVACNTASALAGDFLKKKYSDIPIYDVITPVIERIAAESKQKENLKVGLIGTKGTIESQIYEKNIKRLGNGVEVYAKACPLFVPLAEEGWLEHDITYQVAKEYLAELIAQKVNHLVLGCTHYPLLEAPIKKIVGENIEIISSAREIARTLNLNEQEYRGSGLEKYCFSDWTDSYQRLVKIILKKPIVAEKMQL